MARRHARSVRPVASVPALVLLALLGSPGARPATAAPPAAGVEVYAEPYFGGAVEAVTLAPGERQRTFRPRVGLGSVLLGEHVGLLIQRYGSSHRVPTYAVVTSGRPTLPDALTTWNDFLVVFRKGAPRGVFPHGHPDGVAFSEVRSTTVVGGTNPEIDLRFFPAPTKTTFIWIRDRDAPWVQIFGPSTRVRLRDVDGKEHVFGTDGRESIEFDLRQRLEARTLQHLEVETSSGSGASPFSAAPPQDARARWVHPSVLYRLMAGGVWVEYRDGNPIHAYQEAGRTAVHVEIHDASRNVRLRLVAGGVQVLGTSGAYAPLLAGGGWADPRDCWVAGPGHYFRNAAGNVWDEIQGGRAPFSFVETARTAEYVEIADGARGIALRLHSDRAAMLRRADASPAWRVTGTGGWEREPAPPLQPTATPPPTAPPAPAVPTPGGAPDLAGTWVNDLGVEYRLTQQGVTFGWTVRLTGEKGEGRWTSPTDLSVRWSGILGHGSATGRVVESDPSGRPRRIQWSNGATFRRK